MGARFDFVSVEGGFHLCLHFESSSISRCDLSFSLCPVSLLLCLSHLLMLFFCLCLSPLFSLRVSLLPLSIFEVFKVVFSCLGKCQAVCSLVSHVCSGLIIWGCLTESVPDLLKGVPAAGNSSWTCSYSETNLLQSKAAEYAHILRQTYHNQKQLNMLSFWDKPITIKSSWICSHSETNLSQSKAAEYALILRQTYYNQK